MISFVVLQQSNLTPKHSNITQRSQPTHPTAKLSQIYHGSYQPEDCTSHGGQDKRTSPSSPGRTSRRVHRVQVSALCPFPCFTAWNYFRNWMGIFGMWVKGYTFLFCYRRSTNVPLKSTSWTTTFGLRMSQGVLYDHINCSQRRLMAS